jgi:hypothetical protein
MGLDRDVHQELSKRFAQILRFWETSWRHLEGATRLLEGEKDLDDPEIRHQTELVRFIPRGLEFHAEFHESSSSLIKVECELKKTRQFTVLFSAF